MMTPGELRRLACAGAMASLAALCAPLPATAQRSLITDDDNSSINNRSCMTDRMMRNFLADSGFTNVSLNVSSGRRWPAKGTKDGQVHLLNVDTCARQIYYRGGR